MADDKYTNEDPEERDDQFDDDEDFGLPDLEYDELDEDEGIEDDSFGDLGSDFDSEPAQPEEIPTISAPPVEVPVIAKKESFEQEEEIDIPDTDLTMDDSEDWEKELEMELESELQEEDSPGFYEEESYDDFDSSSSEETTVKSVFDSDSNKGKDDVFASGGGFKSEPVKPAAPAFKETYAQKSVAYQAYNEDDKGNKGKFVRTVVIGTVSIVIVGSLFYWLSTQSNSAKSAKKEEPKKEVKKVEPVVEKPIEKPVEPPVEKPVEKPKPVAGEITKLEQASGKTYIIVGSFFDDDLATDFAKELAAKGQSPFVIPPFKTSKFFRVAIAGYDSFDDAKANIEGFKAEYGQDIWPLRY